MAWYRHYLEDERRRHRPHERRGHLTRVLDDERSLGRLGDGAKPKVEPVTSQIHHSYNNITVTSRDKGKSGRLHLAVILAVIWRLRVTGRRPKPSLEESEREMAHV